MEHIVLLLLLVTGPGNKVLQAETVTAITSVTECEVLSHQGFKSGAITPQPTHTVSGYCVDITAGTSKLVDSLSNPAALDAEVALVNN